MTGNLNVARMNHQETYLFTALVVMSEKLGTFAVIGPGFVVRAGQLPGPIHIAAPVGVTWRCRNKSHSSGSSRKTQRTSIRNNMPAVTVYSIIA